jgi:hypothetical protein
MKSPRIRGTKGYFNVPFLDEVAKCKIQINFQFSIFLYKCKKKSISHFFLSFRKAKMTIADLLLLYIFHPALVTSAVPCPAGCTSTSLKYASSQADPEYWALNADMQLKERGTVSASQH